jgi:predicted RNase H-like HicB family nuclease
MRYAVVVEEGENSYGAYVPDLPGCIAAAKTKAEVLKLIREAIEFHIEGLREEGLPVPVPTSSIEYIEVRAA